MSTEHETNKLKVALRPAALIDKSGRTVLLAEPVEGHGPTTLSGQCCWWYKVAGHGWSKVPRSAMDPFDEKCAFVRVYPDWLGLEPSVHEVEIGVSDGEEVEPQHGGKLCPVVVSPGKPDVPFVLDGNGADHLPHARRVEVSLSRSRVPNTPDEILWVVIRGSTNSLSFQSYQDFMDRLFCHRRFAHAATADKKHIAESFDDVFDLANGPFAYSSVDAYRVLKVATEIFVMTHCGVVPRAKLHTDPPEDEARFGHELPGKFSELWAEYLAKVGPPSAPRALILPYVDLIRRKLGDIGTVHTSAASIVDLQTGLLQEKLVHPCLLELIWSYWMEEGMLVQTFNSITRRFQNVRASANGERDPFAQLEIDPLRPLNNLLWGWVQDELSQLSVLRRAHEYDHQYGFTLHGRALAELRTIDRRSKFLEAFHNLLWRCMQFYRQDDDTTVIADGFSVLNALKETHYLLAQGAHNQFGDLPTTARQEMLMQQWLLSRPEMREFLGGRVMVPYPEAWMDRVDAVKTLKGWTDTSVVHFRDLAVFGEQVLLSVRWGAWSTVNDPNNAANWARYWRAEIQGYIHAYRAATSVDLSAEVTDARDGDRRFLPPSVHLRNRLLGQGQQR
ncbi:MAG TPA: hypothetical protein VKB80_07325 [Kofleriaceae bacterium]|nr:hypothetical protein [Kofleriaceae bacterium]